MVRTVLLTSTHARHRHLALRLYETTNLLGIVTESKSTSIEAVEQYDPADQALMTRHFQRRADVEAAMFSRSADWPAVDRRDVLHGELNSEAASSWVDARAPEILVLFGCSILKEPLLARYEHRIINVHLGLSPYYRGSGTNIWPLYYREPECVGATIHLAVRDVDAGLILHQVRPEPDPHDDEHTFGNKAILAASHILPVVIDEYAAGRLKGAPPVSAEGKLFRVRDFTPAVLRDIREQVDTGMMHDYVVNRTSRDHAKPIVQQL